MSLRISDLEAIPVSVPFCEPFEIAGGAAEEARHVILRLTSTGGEAGYGESAPMSSYSPQSQDGVMREIERIRPLIIDANPLHTERFHAEVRRREIDSFAAAGVDIALHDLGARCLDIPVSEMFGGPVCDGVELSWAIGLKPAERMVDEALRFKRIGFRTVKIKIGRDPEADLERVRQVREAVGPDVKIKVDANQGYDLQTATEVGRELEVLDVSVFEQPLPRGSLDEMAYLREHIDIPVMADESLYNIRDGYEILKYGSADIFNIKIMKPGGLYPSSKLVHLAESAGMPCMLGSMPELGIGTLGGLQLASTSDVFTYGSELIGPWMLEDHLLVDTPQLRDGKVILPAGNGLGIKVDETKLERYRT